MVSCGWGKSPTIAAQGLGAELTFDCLVVFGSSVPATSELRALGVFGGYGFCRGGFEIWLELVLQTAGSAVAEQGENVPSIAPRAVCLCPGGHLFEAAAAVRCFDRGSTAPEWARVVWRSVPMTNVQ